MAPEQLPGKYPINQAKQKDLLEVDTWQLGPLIKQGKKIYWKLIPGSWA